MPRGRVEILPVYSGGRHPWGQVAPGHTGLVLAQGGEALPTGAESAGDKPEVGSLADVSAFLANGGQRGVQRPVLPPGTTVPMHPVGFVVLTTAGVFGKMISEATAQALEQIEADALKVVHITPQG